jgi:macrolide-specific efflux system membrane fusion protein
MKIKQIGWGWRIGIGVVCLLAVYWIISSSAENGNIEVIRTATVTRGDIVVKITATGEVMPQNRVEIKPPIDGRIEEVLVEEGDVVKRGQVLAWMSSTDRAALMDAARAQGPEAVERWENAYKPAPLIAPLDGTVIVRAAEPGQTVAKGDPVVVLADRLIVQGLVDETDLSLISRGQNTEIRLDAYPDQTARGVVDHISYESRLVNNVNVYEVDVLPEKVPAMFRSGMTATVTFIVAARENVLRVPSEAISGWPAGMKKPENAQFALYKKNFSGKLVPTPVRIGKSDGRMTEILEGASEGEEVQVIRRKKASGGGSNPFTPFGRQRQRRRTG